MPKKYRFIDDMFKEDKQPCAVPRCHEPGEYPAPKSPDTPRDFQYFCLEHIKQFNKGWDFFQGKSQSEIERFQRNAPFGERPTWARDGAGPTTAQLEAALGRFMGDASAAAHIMAPPIPEKHKHALKQLDLEHPTAIEAIKKRYKELVKRWHPDRNPGDVKAEETFKTITNAWHLLRDEYES